MKPAPTIAILVPAFNAAAYLPRLLGSLAAQTEPFDEIWVYDDCSTDDTVAIAERHGAIVIRGDINRGCTYAKNRLAAATKADWLHFHDSDDELGPRFVELARPWMANASADVVLFPYEERDDATGKHMAYRYFDAADVARDPCSYAIRVQINPFCGLYRRTAFLNAGGYDEDPLVHYNEDVAMHIGLAFAGLRFSAENQLAIINHRRGNSMSAANRLKCLQAQYNVMYKTALRADARLYGREICRRLWDIVGCLAAELDWKTVDAALELITRISGSAGAPGNSIFGVLSGISPRLAVRIREFSIRIFKPKLRRGYPGWSSI
jgi:glycosyltransferase involved in cell wall biosynthesis